MNSSSFLKASVSLLFRLLVGSPFLVSGVLKIWDPAAFATAIANFRLVPHASINALAVFLPWIELVAGLSVLSGVRLRAGVLIILVLTLVFIGAVSSALARGLSIECGCFGSAGGGAVGRQTLMIDGGLLCLAALLLWRSRDTDASTRTDG